MQRRVAEGRPEVKDAFTDFEKLGHCSPRSRARVFFFFFLRLTPRETEDVYARG